MRIFRTPFWLLALLMLAGCQSAPQSVPGWTVSTVRPVPEAVEAPAEQNSERPSAVQPSVEGSLSLQDDLLQAQAEMKGLLYAQLKDWRAVRYQLGGMSRKGIDCSAFVYLTFRDRLGIELPRNTRDQSRIGRTVAQSELMPGDLVFFQINPHTRHVGIYLEERKFMHVSYKEGVTLSSLDNAYWAKRYWKAVRVPGAFLALARND